MLPDVPNPFVLCIPRFAMTIAQRLETYTLKKPELVLLVTAEDQGETMEILIFKGFSSSLTDPTAFDPDVPVLPHSATIEHIDILQSPYNPAAPVYVQRGLSWSDMEAQLRSLHL